MNLSYWEYKTWLSNIDFTIVGSGIVGINCALHLKSKYPNAKILILEKGILPQGASTKNAGFACFGSVSEILSDLRNHSEEKVISLVQQRWDGIQILRDTLGDETIGFQNYGGHELFLHHQSKLYENCLEKLDHINIILQPIFGKKPFSTQKNKFNFKGIEKKYITHTLESQLDTGKMMQTLLHKAQKQGVSILNGITVEDFVDNGNSVSLKTNKFELKTQKLLIATNGFASQLTKEKVLPARAQVLITKPIKNLHIKGTFHLDEGYYYFRNIDDRILFGGGRNLDFKAEETTQFGQTTLVQNQLEKILRQTILPNIPFDIENRWSGIMGVGKQKHPIIKHISQNVVCGVRLGGMGVAIGSFTGKELANLVE